MRFSIAAAAAALVAGAAAHPAAGNGTAPVYVTEVVTALTTYCPLPTEITHGGSTYTVTSATTLTITDCPCTITHPATAAPPPAATHPAPPAPPAVSHPGPPAAIPTPSATKPSAAPSKPAGGAPPTFTGAAANLQAGAGAAVLGLAAFFL